MCVCACLPLQEVKRRVDFICTTYQFIDQEEGGEGPDDRRASHACGVWAVNM